MEVVAGVSAIAAFVQLGGYILDCVQLLQGLKNGSSQMADLLKELELDIGSITRILQPQPPSGFQLSTDQQAQVEPLVTAVHTVMLNLQQQIEQVGPFSQGNNGKKEKLLLLLRSSRKKKKFNADVGRVKRLTSTLLVELQRLGLEGQSQIKTHITGLESKIDNLELAIFEHGKNTIETATILRDLQTSVHRAPSLLSDSSLKLKVIQCQLAENSRDQQTFQIELKGKSSQITDLLAQDQPFGPKATDIVGAICQELSEQVKYQRSMAERSQNQNAGRHCEAMQNSVFEVDCYRHTASIYLRPKLKYCSACEIRRNLKIQTYGPFKFKIKSDTACPRHGQKESWGYSIVARLGPFLSKSLEFTIGGFLGRGDWRISPSLRVRATLKRSDSPLFRRFDQFKTNCLRYRDTNSTRIYVNRIGSELDGLLRDLNKERDTGRLGDIDELGNTMLFEIFGIIRLLFVECLYFDSQLEELFALAYGAGIDPSARAEDPRKHPLTWAFEKENGINLSPNLSPRTAAAFLLEYLDTTYIPCVELPSESKGKGVIPACNGIMRYEGFLESVGKSYFGTALHGSTLKRQYQILQLLPGLALGLGYSDFCIAILDRNLEAVRRMIIKGRTRDRPKEPDGCEKFSPIELAVSWPEGLNQLLDDLSCSEWSGSDFEFRRAFKLACELGDLEAVRTLLQSKYSIFAPITSEGGLYGDIDACWALKIAISTARQQSRYCPWYNIDDEALSTVRLIVSLVVEELVNRRKQVNDLALTCLSADQLERYGVTLLSVLDQHAEAVFYALSCLTDIPRELDCCRTGNLYHVTGEIEHPEGLYLSNVLDALFDAGFTGLDIYDEETESPLYKFLCKVRWSQPCLETTTMLSATIDWFRDHGAKPVTFAHSKLLFLAASAMDLLWDDIDDNGGRIWTTRLAETLSTMLHCEKISDSCECFCSTQGCLPPYSFWRCEKIANEPENHQSCKNRLKRRHETLHLWIKLFQEHNSDEVYEEIWRLELFERLGMTHTCCGGKNAVPRSTYPLTGYTNAERERIRSIDAPKAQYVEAFLSQYHTMKAQYVGKPAEEFLSMWQQIVDEVLPPLLPREACHRCLVPATTQVGNNREGVSEDDLTRRIQEVREERRIRCQNALLYAGYKDMDYGDIVKVHFTKNVRINTGNAVAVLVDEYYSNTTGR